MICVKTRCCRSRPGFLFSTTLATRGRPFPAKPTCKRTRPVTAALSPSLRSRIPMLLTYARVAAIPALCVCGLTNPPQYVFSTALFAAASFTDFLDGYLARKWSAVTPMGTFLDPVADKLMVAVALTLITARLPHPAIVISTAIIVCREIFVSALREWMALLGKSSQVKVSFWGKLKTATQMVAVTLLLLVSSLTVWYAKLGVGLLCGAAFLSLFSAGDYITSAAQSFTD